MYNYVHFYLSKMLHIKKKVFSLHVVQNFASALETVVL